MIDVCLVTVKNLKKIGFDSLCDQRSVMLNSSHMTSKLKFITLFVVLKYYKNFYTYAYIIYTNFYCYEKIIADRNWIVSKK